MVGEPDMPRGLQGVIDFVDDIGNIHVKWDNFRTLALIYGKDSFIILEICSNKECFTSSFATIVSFYF